VSASQLLETLSSARGSHLWAAVAVSLLIELVLAARLRIIARVQQMTPTFAQTLQIDLAAKFYGLFAPGGNFSGSAIRAYKLTRLHGDALGSVASIVFDRLIATASLGFVGQVFWILERPPRTGSVGLVLLATWLLPLGLYVVSRRAEASGRVSRSAPRSWPAGWLHRTQETVARFKDMRAVTLFGTVAASVAVHVLGVLLYLMLAASLKVEISFVSIGWIAMATTLVTMVPVTVSGLGLREGTLVYLLSLYGVAAADAMALSLLYFAARFLVMGLAGGLIEAVGRPPASRSNTSSASSDRITRPSATASTDNASASAPKYSASSAMTSGSGQAMSVHANPSISSVASPSRGRSSVR
jgi:uncharacterized protein (TIRG00374 family)